MPHASSPATLADLSHNALIAVSGDDAAAFLQGLARFIH
jgi:folate-binding Fe-S cluster repair protein YgfZ